MNTNDLRLDNWLFGHDPSIMQYNEKGYFQVYNLEDDRINVWRVEGFGDESATAEPIPLTPEILEKCGFEREGLQCDYTKNEVDLYNHDEGYRFGISGYVMQTNYLYLHQLQNLYFALTGTELEINL